MLGDGSGPRESSEQKKKRGRNEQQPRGVYVFLRRGAGGELSHLGRGRRVSVPKSKKKGKGQTFMTYPESGGGVT